MFSSLSVCSFFFFKQKTAYEMRVSDWSSTCALPIYASVGFNVAEGGGGDDDGYYAHVNASSPGQLRCSLHETIRGHTVYPYSGSGTSTWTILEIADEDPANAGRILDAYRNRSYRSEEHTSELQSLMRISYAVFC